MGTKWIIRLIEAAAVTVALAAICQELEKPKEQRRWHGKGGFIPYDPRRPSSARVQELFWNPESSEVFTPTLWGIGWSINIFALLEKLRIISESYESEEDFLMPTQTLRRILERRPVV